MDNTALNLLHKNSGVYAYKFGKWSESDHHIEMTIYSPTYSKFSKGDIYFRPSQNGRGCRVQIFTGEGDNSYDQNFEAGTRYWYATVVDINALVNAAYKNSPDAFQALQNLLTKMGFPIT